MKFSQRRLSEPQINLIPFIDVLLVVVLFLLLCTTYNPPRELQIRLPTISPEASSKGNRAKTIVVSVSADGRYTLRGRTIDSVLEGDSRLGLLLISKALQVALVQMGLDRIASTPGAVVLVIQADAQAPHQSVVTLMEAGQQLGLMNVTFATQTPQR